MNRTELGPRTLLIMPAWNESDVIAKTIRTVREELAADLLVIDDGSGDSTAELAATAGAIVIQHPYNLGVGAAIHTGLRFGFEHRYDRVVQIDADGQHDPVYVPILLRALDSADMVVGTRFGHEYKTGVLRRIVMRALSKRVSRPLGIEINDTTSGFRAFGPAALAAFAQSYPSAYLCDTVEALLMCGEQKLRVATVEVKMQHRQGGIPSSGPFKSGLYLVRLSLLLVVNAHQTPRIVARRLLPS